MEFCITTCKQEQLLLENCVSCRPDFLEVKMKPLSTDRVISLRKMLLFYIKWHELTLLSTACKLGLFGEIVKVFLHISNFTVPFFIIRTHKSCIHLNRVRFEVFTAVTMKNGVFLDVTPCGSCKNRRFGGT
jgi:hypothetical protein